MLDFSKSWKDGKAIVAMVHKRKPNMIDFTALENATDAERWRAGMEAVEKLGAPHLVSSFLGREWECHVFDLRSEPI